MRPAIVNPQRRFFPEDGSAEVTVGLNWTHGQVPVSCNADLTPHEARLVAEELLIAARLIEEDAL